jgi:hypothetical protein
MIQDDSVTRYVVTYINGHGMRTLAYHAWGQYTYATEAEAQAMLDATIANNSESTIRQIFGDNPKFEVRPCSCWPGHFDPKTVWFDQ